MVGLQPGALYTSRQSRHPWRVVDHLLHKPPDPEDDDIRTHGKVVSVLPRCELLRQGAYTNHSGSGRVKVVSTIGRCSRDRRRTQGVLSP